LRHAGNFLAISQHSLNKSCSSLELDYSRAPL